MALGLPLSLKYSSFNLQEAPQSEWYVGEYSRQAVEEALIKENKVTPPQATGFWSSAHSVPLHDLAFLSAGQVSLKGGSQTGFPI